MTIAVIFAAPLAVAASYTWTYNANGGGGTMTATTTFSNCRANELGGIALPTRSGFTLLGWSLNSRDGVFLGLKPTKYTDCTNITLFAQWNYTVTLDANGGSVAQPSITNAGAGVVLPAATRDGFSFSGWFTASTGGTRVGGTGATYNPNANTTIYAQWTPETYAVTYEANGGTVAPTSANFTTGDPALPLPTPTRAQHTFNGWYTSPAGGDLIGTAGAAYTPTGSATLHAQWTFVSNPSPPDQAPAPAPAPDGLELTAPEGVTAIRLGDRLLIPWATNPYASGYIIYVDGVEVLRTTNPNDAVIQLPSGLHQIGVRAANGFGVSPLVSFMVIVESTNEGDPESEPVAPFMPNPVVRLGRELIVTPERIYTPNGQPVRIDIRVQERRPNGNWRKAKANTFRVIRNNDGLVAVRRIASRPLRAIVTWAAPATPSAPARSITRTLRLG